MIDANNQQVNQLNQTPALQKILLPVSILLFTLFLTSCKSGSSNYNRSPEVHTERISLTETKDAALDSIVYFLLDACAKDFHDHQPPAPVSFRNVKVRNLIGPNAENHYILCGQFLARDKQDKDEWTDFATIKTSGYEQWIGNQSLSFCQESKAQPYKIIDLSSELKNRFDALQNSAK